MRTVGQLFRRLLWMFKGKDCRHVCLFCEHYHVCTIDGVTERSGKEMNMKYAMRSEDTEQIAVVQWAQYNVNHYPELRWLHHCPNGGSRNRLEAVKLKQMGVKAGVSDLCLPYPKGIYCGLYIEMKYGNNRQTDSQKDFLADMAAVGHFVATCYSAEEAISVITEYLGLNRCFNYAAKRIIEDYKKEPLGAIAMENPNNSILKDGKVKRGGGAGDKVAED